MSSNPEASPKEQEVSLTDYLRVLVKHRTLIGLVMGSMFLLSVVYSVSLPKIYTSTASILPPQQEGGSLQSQLQTTAAGGLLLQGKSPGDLWVGILGSRSVKDAIINRFRLMKAFRVTTRDDARRKLGGMVSITKSRENIISITVENTDPRKAAQMANAFVEELDRINKSVVMTAGRRMRVFVEERLKEAREELAKAEETVKVFQEKNRAVKLDDQSKVVIESMGAVKGQLMAKEVELQTFLSYATPTNPQAEILRTQVEELRERLRELEEGKTKLDNPGGKDIFIPTTKIPQLSLEYARLLRDAKVQETLHGLLSQQYEMARIQEAKDTPTVQVLDTAQVPERKAKPGRMKIVFFFMSFSAILATFLAFLLEYLGKLKGIKAHLNQPYSLS